MHWGERRERFRGLLEGDRCVHPGSVFDAMSARIAEDLGFEVGMFAGSVASMSVLGAPDLIVLTLSEFADQAYRICRAGNIALLCDADHGYGNALNVKRTVEELESAGVCALSIEDTDLPQPYGTVGSSRLLSIEEGVGISAETTLPIIIGGAPALQDLEYLSSSTSVRICLQGHQPIMAAVQAVYSTLKALREGANPGDLPGVASAELMGQVTRDDDYRRWMDEFL